MTINVDKLIEILYTYDRDLEVRWLYGQEISHISNESGHVLLSDVRPIGICPRTGGNVYPSDLPDYAGYCPELDENLTEIEYIKSK